MNAYQWGAVLLAASGFSGWLYALWMRFKNAQAQNVQLETQVTDLEIEQAVHAESDADLDNEVIVGLVGKLKN